MGRRKHRKGQWQGTGKPYEGHESLTGWLQSLAYRAGIPDAAFWKMTAHNVVSAFIAGEQNMSRLAWRTAYFRRVQHRHFPKNEDAIFAKSPAARPAKRRQSLRDQYAMARLITKVMH